MTIKKLDADEVEAIGYALRLLARGDLIEEWEFDTRIGVELSVFRTMLDSWPNWDDSSDDSLQCQAVNNTLNDILHGLGLPDHDVEEATGVDRAELLRVYRKWRISRGWRATGLQ